MPTASDLNESRALGLAIVVVTDGLEAIVALLEALTSQTARNRLEVILVVPAGAALRLEPSSTSAFGDLRVVSRPSIVPLHEARAAGVMNATAPVVVVGETHAYPDPAWAAALMEAHQGPWTAVVPVIRSGNPGGPISSSNFLLTYGPWMWEDVEETEKVPEQNTAFKRTALLAYGDRLGTMLETGSGLSADLHSKGHRFAIAREARLRHVNVSRPSTWLPERFYAGRAFGATRAAGWTAWRRVVYAAGFPFIVPVFLARSLRATRWPKWQRELPALTLPALVLGVLSWAFGEVLGYLLGIGAADSRMAEYEINRQRYVAPSQ